MRKTRIIASIGPASRDLDTLRSLIGAGVNVCRLNFSFDDHEYHRENIRRIRQVAAEFGRDVAIMQDLQGPKIRIGKLAAPVNLQKDDRVVLSGSEVQAGPLYLPTTYACIANDTKPGKTILLADGRIILTVEEVFPEKKEVHCRVLNGGTLLTGKGINLPYTDISIPALTEKDIKDAEFGIEAGVDFIALSFVRYAEDVMCLRDLIKRMNADTPVIAKIEKPEALDNLDEILDVVDGVMVARGDLAGEISFEHVPVAQKTIIRKANAKDKISIVATEMLSSMTENPLPTRAEVSDVANAVLDGADMVMLSNETAAGKQPLRAVQAMSAIAVEAEKMLDMCPEPEEEEEDAVVDSAFAMCSAAAYLSCELRSKAIIVLTTTGETARLLAKARPTCQIVAATYDQRIYRRMYAYHNVNPMLLEGEPAKNTMEAQASYEQIYRRLKDSKQAVDGDNVIVLAGITASNGQKWQLNEIQSVVI